MACHCSLVPVVTFNVAGRVVSIRYPPDGHGGTERLLGGFVAGPFPLQSGTTFHPFLASTHPAVPTLVPDGPGGRLLGTENQGRRGNAGSHQGPPPPLDPPNCLSAQCVFNALHHHCTSTLASVMYPCCCLTFGCSRPPFWHAWASLSFSLPPPSPPPTVTLLSGYTAVFSHLIPFSNHWVTAVGELSLSVLCLPQPPGLSVSSQGIAPQPKRADPYETIEPFHAPGPIETNRRNSISLRMDLACDVVCC